MQAEIVHKQKKLNMKRIGIISLALALCISLYADQLETKTIDNIQYSVYVDNPNPTVTAYITKDASGVVEPLTNVQFTYTILIDGEYKQVTKSFNCTRLRSATYLENVTSVVIPEGYTGLDGLKACSFESLYIPTTAKRCSFEVAKWDNLKSVHIKSLEAWCNIDYMSAGCNPLMGNDDVQLILNGSPIEELVIPESISTIKKYAFAGGSFKTITITPNVVSIEDGAFEYCHKLTKMEIPANVKKLGGYLFYDCYNLKNFIIADSDDGLETLESSVPAPKNRLYIGRNLPKYSIHYGGMEELVLGAKITSLSKTAFQGCVITNIISHIENPFPIDDLAFEYVYDRTPLYVPVGTSDKYKNCAGWKNFTQIKEGTPTNIEVATKQQLSKKDIYTLDGKRVSEPQKGVNIVRMNDGATRKVVVK